MAGEHSAHGDPVAHRPNRIRSLRFAAPVALMSILEVAAGMIFRDGRLLITQRPPGAHLAGLWEFPGGKREPQETYSQCLRREIAEELGVDVEVGELVAAVTHAYPEKTVHLKFFQCELRRGEPQSLGCPAFRWVRCEELGDFEFPAADAQLIAKLQQTRELWRAD